MNDNMEIKKSTSRLVYVVIMLLIVVLGGTFAWLTYRSKQAALVLTIGDLNDTEIILTPYQINEVMAPGTTYTSGVYSDVSVNSGTKETSVLLYYKINNLDTTLIDKGLSYTVVDSSDTTVASGYFSDLIDTSEPLPEEVVILNTTSSDETYKVYLWVDSSVGNQSDIQNTTLDVELNGSIGSVSILGTPMYQQTLNTVIHDTNDSDATYTYQWYVNTTNSTTGGTPIEGATKNSYTVESGLVGKYIYVVVDVHDMDYTGRYYSDITTVIQPITSVITLDAKEKTYDGKQIIARGAMTNSDGSIEYTYYTDSSCTTATSTSNGAFTSGGAPIDAGNYYVKASVVSSSGNYSIASTCVSHKINKKEIEASWGSESSFVYSGVGQAPSVNDLTGVTVGSVTENITMQRSTQVNAGSYTSTASCDYVTGGRAKCDNYSFTNITKDFTITKKELTISLSASDKIYDSTTTATCNVTLTGAVNSEQPTATATGVFTADSNVGTDKNVSCTGVTLADSWGNNYSLNATSGTTTASITQKSITVPWDTSTLSFPYDGSSHIPSLTSNPMNGVGDEKITFSISVSGYDNGPSAVDSYTATASCSSVSGGNAKCTNYSFTSTTQTFTITKATPVIEVNPTSGTVEAGSTSTFTATVKSSPSVSGTLTAESGTTSRVTITGGESSSITATSSGVSQVITYKGESTEGDSTITLTFTPTDTTNFNTVTKTFTATNDDTVAPTTPTLSRSDYNTFTYEAEDSGTGIASYCVSTTNSTSNCSWVTATSKDISAAGTYYVWAKDVAGNVSSAGSIAAYTMTRSQGEGTTLTTRYDSTSSSTGTSFTSNTVVLVGTSIWAKSEATAGYHTPTLKFGSTTQTASGALFTVSAAQTITSAATPNVATITVNKDGSAWDASGMDVCLSTSSTSNTSFSCSTVSSGSTATFNGVVPDTTYYIWGGKDSSNTTSMAYSGSSIVGASPDVSGTINYWTLTLNLGTGIDSVSGGKIYLNNQDASISATPTSGYSFDNWSGGTPASTTSASTTMDMTQTTTLTANGVVNTATITINKDGSGWTNSGIKVCLSTSAYTDNSTSALCSTVSSGTVATITKVVTNTTYYIWAGKSDSSKTTLAYSGVSFKGAKTVAATVNYYSLTVSKGTGISSVSGTGTYLSTQSASISATTSSGYSFGSWTKTAGNAPDSTTSASTTVSMSQTTSLTANGVANTATITIKKDGSNWGSTYSSNGISVALQSGTTVKYAYSAGTVSGATVTWSAIESGTYDIYAGKNEDNKTTLVDTGVDITVTGTGTATINYYTISRSQGTGTTLTTKYDSSSGTSFTSNKVVLSGQTIYAQSTASAGYNTPTLKHGTTSMTASGGTFTVSAKEAITSAATANTATVTIKKDSSNWSSSGINVALYSGTTVKYAYSAGTASGATVTWSGVTNGTYNVYAGKSGGLTTTLVDTGVDITVSSTGTATINYYTISRSQGTGTTLTTKYDSSSGTAWTSDTAMLNGITIYAKSEANTGYNTPTLTHGSTSMTASGGTFTVSAKETITSAATADPYTITYQGNMFSGLDNSRDFNSGSNSIYYDGTYLTLNGTFTTSLSGYVLGFTETSFTSGEKYNIILTHNSGDGTISTTSNSSFVTEIKNNKMSSLSSKKSVNTSFPSNATSTQTLTIDSTGASSGSFLHFSFVATGNVTFTNYKVKVVVTKVATAEIANGDKYTLPSDPVRNGYTFNGWYTAESGGTKITSSSTMSSTSDHTIYAQWTAKTLKITYDANGGSGTMSDSSYTFGGSDITFSTLAFTNSGHYGSYYYLYNSSKSLYLGCLSGTSCYSQNPTLGWYHEDILSAKYKANTTLDFNANNSMGYDIKAIIQWEKHRTTISIKKDDVEWSSSGMNVALYSGTTQKYSYADATVSENTVVWTGVVDGTYNIYAGKSASAKTTLVDTGVDITVSSYHIGNTIFYYTLTLNPGTGISAVSGADVHLKSQSVNISATAKSGYTFSKWTVSGNSPTSTSAASTTIKLTQATTLTATGVDDISPTGTLSASVSGSSVTATLSNVVEAGSGISKYYYAIVASTASCSGYTDAETNLTYTWDGKDDGEYKVCVKLEDNAGNTQEYSTTVTVETVDCYQINISEGYNCRAGASTSASSVMGIPSGYYVAVDGYDGIWDHVISYRKNTSTDPVTIDCWIGTDSNGTGNTLLVDDSYCG